LTEVVNMGAAVAAAAAVAVAGPAAAAVVGAAAVAGAAITLAKISAISADQPVETPPAPELD